MIVPALTVVHDTEQTNHQPKRDVDLSIYKVGCIWIETALSKGSTAIYVITKKESQKLRQE